MYQYKGTLEKDVDADTAQVTIDLGFGVNLSHVDFRFSAINAPERDTPLGQSAIAFVNTWFKANPTFVIDTTKTRDGIDKKEKWGRWMGTFSPIGGGTSLNQLLVDNGLAKPYNGRGPKP